VAVVFFRPASFVDLNGFRLRTVGRRFFFRGSTSSSHARSAVVSDKGSRRITPNKPADRVDVAWSTAGAPSQLASDGAFKIPNSFKVQEPFGFAAACEFAFQ
jgi:hypothetical protein